MNYVKKSATILSLIAAAGSLALAPAFVYASSHMDAPLITLDPAANTTDVYAFLTERGTNKYLTVALAVYPFEEPGIGPNKYNFDDNVLYTLYVCTTNKTAGASKTDVAAGRATFGYRFTFKTTYQNKNTILQSYLGVITNIGDASQNLVQTYTVQKQDLRFNTFTKLGTGVVPPNNEGLATPFYNQGDNGGNPAKQGASSEAGLDTYTSQGIATLSKGYRAFAGQRDDGFYGDIQAIFDLLSLRNPGVDAQKGFNVHTIVLEIPVSELRGENQVVGVYATTSRPQVTILRDQTTFGIGVLKDGTPFGEKRANSYNGRFVQVGRQGNPLFCEALVGVADKDLYNRTQPTADKTLFEKYALNPELAGLLNALVFKSEVAPTTDRSDLVSIFIPDVIKVDLSTGPARLTGAYADDPGFSTLSIFGGDTLTSRVQVGFGGGTVPGGWPNGRRFGDDVVDIAVTAVVSDLRTSPPTIRGPYGDNVYNNDITYNKVFPYAATPHNGRNHQHH